MANDGFVTARPPKGGDKRRVPEHYLQEPFNFKLPPSTRKADQAASADAEVVLVEEPATTKKKEARP